MSADVVGADIEDQIFGSVLMFDKNAAVRRLQSFCIFLGATNSIADMMSDMQSYQLCVIETSEDPDEALREAICQQQRAVETYDAITNLLDVALCTPEPTFFTYLGLIMNIRGIFTICQEEE